MKQKKNTDSLFIKKRVTVKDFYAGVYDVLEHFKPLLPFINRLIRRYRLYYPWDSKECTFLAVRTLLKIYGISAGVVLIVFGSNPSVFSLVLSGYLIYVFSSEIIYMAHTKLEIKFLKAFDAFLSVNRHHYYKCCSIRDALSLSEIDSDLVIKGHIKEMLKVLSSSDSQAAVNDYVNSGYHKYLKLYITLARLLDENGDQEDEKGSVFLNSCMRIKCDVEEDLRFISERKHRFSGLVLTASLPAMAIPYISMWGVSTIPSLKLFYYGYVGALIKLLLIMLSLICFNAIKRLKYGDSVEKKRLIVESKLLKISVFDRMSKILIRLQSKGTARYEERIRRLSEGYNVKMFMLQKVVYFFMLFILTMVTLYVGHQESRYIYKNDADNIEDILEVTDTRQLSALKRIIPEITTILCESGSVPSEESIKEQILRDKDIKIESVAQKAASEIVKRVDMYGKEIFCAIDIIICFFIAALAFMMPGVALSFRKALIESRMQEEVMQFQSIIHMLKSIPGITVVSLLEEMELFSETFKPAIRECINEFSISDEGALKKLYDRERYPAFRRIVDCFMMADELGISDAFEEISAEIENYSENRKLERKILLDTEGMLGAVISVLPGGAILFGYLLCPFMVRSIQIFNEYQIGLTGL